MIYIDIFGDKYTQLIKKKLFPQERTSRALIYLGSDVTFGAVDVSELIVVFLLRTI